MNPAMRMRISAHVPLAQRAIKRRIDAGGSDSLGRRGLRGQAAVDRAMELLAPAVHGDVPVDDNHAELAAVVLKHAARKLKKHLGG